MHFDTFIMSQVYGRKSRAKINACQPSGIAVSQYIDGIAPFYGAYRLNKRQSILPYKPASFRLLIAQSRGRLSDNLCIRIALHYGSHIIHRPGEIDRSGSGRLKSLCVTLH
jgi:hypothetical protein